MGDTNEYTVHDLVRDELYKNMDVEYGKFTASLSPGAGNIIGVRIPVLRKMAQGMIPLKKSCYRASCLAMPEERSMTFSHTWDGSYQRSMTGRSAIPVVIPLRSQTGISRKCGIS